MAEESKPVVWVDIGEAMSVIKDAQKNKWRWSKNPKCKYVNLTIDMRDGYCVVMDRDKKPISIDELKYQLGGS